MDKINRLKLLVDKFKNLPKQRTKEWFKLKEKSIGGSEISIITGDNKFSNIKNLIDIKIGKKKFYGNLATRWGKLFENVTNNYCKILFNIDEIYDMGSLPTINKNIRYSPDGITLIKINNKNKIILFEYKSPISTIPNGNIPIYYIPQVKLGLWAIHEIDYSIFINNMYRICEYENLENNNKYKKELHKKDNIGEIKPIIMGIITLYKKKKDNIEFEPKYNKDKHKLLIKIIEENNKDKEYRIIDLAKLDKEYINYIFYLIDIGFIEYEIHEIYICEEINNLDIIKNNEINKIEDNKITIQEYKKKINNYIYKNKETRNYLGLLCWKLFRSDIIQINRDNEYINKYMDKINILMEDINLLNKYKNDNNDMFEKKYIDIINKYKK